MLIIPFLLLLLFFGLLITILLKVKAGLAERLSLSYLLGIGLFTFFVFAFDLLFNIDYSINNTFSLLISSCLILFAIKYKDTIEFFKNIKFEKKPFKWQSVLFWSFIGLVTVYTLVVNLYWPVYDWDALALYDFRSKVFLIDDNLIHAAISNDYFMGYPLLTSLSHLFIYQIGLQSPKLIYSLFYFSFIIIFYTQLKKNTSEGKTVFFTIILASIPELFVHSTMAYTNLIYSIYMCTGVFYLFLYNKYNDFFNLIVASILVGLSTWTRNSEPFWLIPLLIVLFVSIKKRKVFHSLLFLIFPFLINFFWGYVVRLTTKTSVVISAHVGQIYLKSLSNVTIDNFFSVIIYLFRNVFSTWGLLFMTLLLILIYTTISKKLVHNKMPQLIIILFILLLISGTLIFSVTFNEWQNIPDSVRRMSMFLLPLMLYSIAIATSNDKNNEKI